MFRPVPLISSRKQPNIAINKQLRISSLIFFRLFYTFGRGPFFASLMVFSLSLALSLLIVVAVLFFFYSSFFFYFILFIFIFCNVLSVFFNTNFLLQILMTLDWPNAAGQGTNNTTNNANKHAHSVPSASVFACVCLCTWAAKNKGKRMLARGMTTQHRKNRYCFVFSLFRFCFLFGVLCICIWVIKAKSKQICINDPKAHLYSTHTYIRPIWFNKMLYA